MLASEARKLALSQNQLYDNIQRIIYAEALMGHNTITLQHPEMDLTDFIDGTSNSDLVLNQLSTDGYTFNWNKYTHTLYIYF